MIQQYRNGVPDSILARNTPVNQSVSVESDFALYAQDSWTMKRLTINAGLRFDHFNGSVNEQTAEAGVFVPARSFAKIPNLPNWNDLSPRLGIAYDLFGDARTAIKASVSKYVQNAATGFASGYNPMFVDTDTRTWTDAESQRPRRDRRTRTESEPELRHPAEQEPGSEHRQTVSRWSTSSSWIASSVPACRSAAVISGVDSTT